MPETPDTGQMPTLTGILADPALSRRICSIRTEYRVGNRVKIETVLFAPPEPFAGAGGVQVILR